jgi:hypothetical protein
MTKYNQNDLDEHRRHCLELAAAAPTEEIRDRFLRVSRLFEIEGRLLQCTSHRILESKVLIAEVEALLRAHTVRIGHVPEPRLPVPYAATAALGPGTAS